MDEDRRAVQVGQQFVSPAETAGAAGGGQNEMQRYGPGKFLGAQQLGKFCWRLRSQRRITGDSTKSSSAASEVNS